MLCFWSILRTKGKRDKVKYRNGHVNGLAVKFHVSYMSSYYIKFVFNFTNFRTLWAAVRSSGEGEVRENEKRIKNKNNKFKQFVQFLKIEDFLLA